MTDVANDQNVPLLEQEEKKTKLPFCIFLLCNGAVGTWKIVYFNIQVLVFLLLLLLLVKSDGEWVLSYTSFLEVGIGYFHNDPLSLCWLC